MTVADKCERLIFSGYWTLYQQVEIWAWKEWKHSLKE